MALARPEGRALLRPNSDYVKFIEGQPTQIALDSLFSRQLPLQKVAKALGITTNNATVRLHRARRALKRELERSCGICATHGCLDCTCGESPCH